MCVFTVVNESKEGFFHQKLSVEDDQFGAGRNEIVAFMEPKELYENLILVVCMKEKEKKKNQKHN